jgi:dTDP-glucose 4,6-dehydratase
MSTLLVIGGSGFFGKSILDAYQRGLLQAWKIDRVIIFSRQATQLRFTHPNLLSDTIELVDGDIGTCDTLPKANYVIHAAASTDAAKYLSAGDTEKNNIIAGTIHFCQLAKALYAHAKILYVSSGAVYGSSFQQKLPFSESDPLMPLEEVPENKRAYTAAKRDSERAIRLLAKEGVSVSIARCFAFVGQYLPRDQHFAIGNFIQNGLEHQAILVKAQHLVYRSYMYADDLVLWLMHLLEAASTTCPIFNLGSDQAAEVGEIANLLAIKMQTTVHRSDVTTTAQDYYVPCIKKAKEELGIHLAFSLEHTLDETIRKISADLR